jgi:hypothetical protein
MGGPVASEPLHILDWDMNNLARVGEGRVSVVTHVEVATAFLAQDNMLGVCDRKSATRFVCPHLS